MYNLWLGQAQYMTILTLFDPCDLDLQPTRKMFQMALLVLEDKKPCINVQVMARTSLIYDILTFIWPCDLDL